MRSVFGMKLKAIGHLDWSSGCWRSHTTRNGRVRLKVSFETAQRPEETKDPGRRFWIPILPWIVDFDQTVRSGATLVRACDGSTKLTLTLDTRPNFCPPYNRSPGSSCRVLSKIPRCTIFKLCWHGNGMLGTRLSKSLSKRSSSRLILNEHLISLVHWHSFCESKCEKTMRSIYKFT